MWSLTTVLTQLECRLVTVGIGKLPSWGLLGGALEPNILCENKIFSVFLLNKFALILVVHKGIFRPSMAVLAPYNSLPLIAESCDSKQTWLLF